MIHIKERLMQYADKYSGCYKYAGVYVKVIQDMIEQLLADLEEDEKENGWIPVSERLPKDGTYITTLDGELADRKNHSRECAVSKMENGMMKTVLLPGCHFQNHIRRTKWDIAN